MGATLIRVRCVEIESLIEWCLVKLVRQGLPFNAALLVLSSEYLIFSNS